MHRLIYTYLVCFLLLIIIFSSCKTTKGYQNKLYDPVEVADLSKKLNIELKNTDKEDDKNMLLYAELASWLGTRYRYGGTSRKGVDCSGFTYLVYSKIYGKKLPRSTAGLSKMKMKNISKNKLQTGDLILFATTKNKKKISHVGIYLKDNKFIHASSSKGVIVSSLDQPYYKKAWRKAGRVL